jgi:hypothetical protein
VHYHSESKETITVVFGKAARNWWCGSDDKESTIAKFASKDSNMVAKKNGVPFRPFAGLGIGICVAGV